MIQEIVLLLLPFPLRPDMHLERFLAAIAGRLVHTVYSGLHNSAIYLYMQVIYMDNRLGVVLALEVLFCWILCQGIEICLCYCYDDNLGTV